MKSLFVLLCATSLASAACDVPGATNPFVTQTNIHQTICVRGWTKTIRPPLAYTSKWKRQLLPFGRRLSEFELDHCIPLELGGHPSAHENLWLQPWGGRCGARAKDEIENRLRSKVCFGQITLIEAQKRVQTWCK